jgi:hypothetical protein
MAPLPVSHGGASIPASRLNREGRTAIQEAKKLAEYAASELSFGNADTGREFLQKALQVLSEVQ